MEKSKLWLMQPVKVAWYSNNNQENLLCLKQKI